MHFTQNNYLRSYGSGDSFRIEIDSPQNKSANFHSVSKSVAEMIHANRQGKLYLMYSGGVDSEYVLNIFLSIGIDITPVIIKLNPNYNEHDVKYAFDFCKSKGLNPLVIDLDFDHFVKSGTIVDIAREFRVGTYQLPSTFHVLNQLDGTIVMGSHGPPHMTKDSISGEWYVDEYEPIHTVLNYFEKNKLYGCPFFLVYTPEQYLSFLQDPTMVALANNFVQGKTGNNSSKWLVYNNGSGFNLRSRQKYTGYENIESSEIFQHPNLKIFEQFEKQWWGIHAEKYFDLVARLTKE